LVYDLKHSVFYSEKGGGVHIKLSKDAVLNTHRSGPHRTFRGCFELSMGSMSNFLRAHQTFEQPLKGNLNLLPLLLFEKK